MSIRRAVVEVVCDMCADTLPVGPVEFAYMLAPFLVGSGWVRRPMVVALDGVAWEKGRLLDLCPRCHDRYRARLQQYVMASARGTHHGH